MQIKKGNLKLKGRKDYLREKQDFSKDIKWWWQTAERHNLYTAMFVNNANNKEKGNLKLERREN